MNNIEKFKIGDTVKNKHFLPSHHAVVLNIIDDGIWGIFLEVNYKNDNGDMFIKSQASDYVKI